MKPNQNRGYIWWLTIIAVTTRVVFWILNNLKWTQSLFKNQIDFVKNYYDKSNDEKVWFSNQGRGGSATYQSKEGSFTMYWEFGGMETVVSIYIPNSKDWVAETGIPLERREAILNFIGQQAIKTQNAGRGTYKIDENYIFILS